MSGWSSRPRGNETEKQSSTESQVHHIIIINKKQSYDCRITMYDSYGQLVQIQKKIVHLAHFFLASRLSFM
jgi:hypothetical protein